jgi:glycosyltransferase involved in cell wall biosynthesis
MNKVVIAIPVFNEIDSIEIVLSDIKQLGYDCFVVDNNSTDGSTKKATDLGMKVYQRDEFGQGYGCSILKAISVAKELNYDYLAFMDCDYSYGAQDLKKLIEKRANFDLIIGNREYSKIEFVRRWGNYFHNIIASILYLRLIKDLNSGMRVLKISNFYNILSAKDMGMVSQITCLALMKRFKILELSINYNDRLGKSKLSIFKDGFIILQRIIVERFKY